jgi:hypothetical protein
LLSLVLPVVLDILKWPVAGYNGGVEFCNQFDEELARRGPAGVFLFDHKGRLRFDSSWTRDVWQRAPAEPNGLWRWLLLRDRDSGFVQLALVTSSNLIPTHPRLQIRVFESLEEARAVRQGFGAPPVSKEVW